MKGSDNVFEIHEMAGGSYHLSICEGVRACKLDTPREDCIKKIVHSDRRETFAKLGDSVGNMVSKKPVSCRLTGKVVDPE
jgi:hypothetical protein